MYPPALAEALRGVGLSAYTVRELGMVGCSDAELFATAVADGYVLLTENVADFTRLSAEHVTAGRRHPGLLIALSSRFSRRPSGIGPLAEDVRAVAGEPLEDRVVYLRPGIGSAGSEGPLWNEI